MKKRAFSILATILVFVMCSFLSACGDKYRDLEFNITYAFSEDASEWYDANNGVVLNYGTEGDPFVLDDSTGGTIYFRVEIRNVKEKYIDEIMVTTVSTSSNLLFTSATVSQNQVFAVQVAGNAVSTLRFYETNSGKSKEISFGVYRSLESIEVDSAVTPAIVNRVGNSIDLNQLDNLIYLPQDKNGNPLTNQTGVLYEIDSTGYYDASNEYHINRNADSVARIFSIDGNGILSILSDFTIETNNYILRIKATSRYNSEISAYFDVYLVENQAFSPRAYYLSEYNNGMVTDISEITLYKDSTYATTDLVIDLSDLNSVYTSGVYTMDGSLSYEIAIYIDGERYDLSIQDEDSDIIVTKVTNAENQYRISIRNVNNVDTYDDVTFAVELSDAHFQNNSAPNYQKTVRVYKSILPNNISVNDELAQNGHLYGSIYYNSTYNGITIKLDASPISTISSTEILIEKNTNLNISGVTLSDRGDYYAVSSGDSITVRFLSGSTVSSTDLILRVKNTPATFENETVAEGYVTVVYTINKIVTADEIGIYSYSNTIVTDPAYQINDEELTINANSDTKFYLLVDYAGTTLDRSSIELRIERDSTNQRAIRFSNGSTTLRLNDASVVMRDSATGQALFEITLDSINTEATADIVITAGAEVTLLEEKFSIRSVYVMDESTGISIEPYAGSEGVTSFNDTADTNYINNGHYNFAIVRGNSVIFNVLSRVSGASTLSSDAISVNRIERLQEDNNLSGFSNSSSILSYGRVYNTEGSKYDKLQVNTLSVGDNGTGTVTQIITVYIQYYTVDTNNLVQSVEQAVKMEIAVYEPIASVQLEISDREIVYINSMYEDAASTEIRFNSLSYPSRSVTFTDGDTVRVINSVSQLRFNVSGVGYDENSPVEIYLSDSQTALANNSILDALTGEIVVRLTADPRTSGLSDITISFTALQFGTVTDARVSTNIQFADYELANGISVSGSEIVQNGQDSYYIYMSFIDVEAGEDSAEFYAEATYSNSEAVDYNDIGYKLYQIEQDANGNISLDENDQAIMHEMTNQSGVRVVIEDIENSNQKRVIIYANKNYGGGLFRLMLGSMDSYNEETGEYDTTFSLFISISDGTLQNKYLISDQSDLANIVNNMDSHFVLCNNIEISGDWAPIGKLTSGIEEFTGTLTGSMDTLNSDNEIISTARYKIIFTANDTALDSEGNVYSGLFARLGHDARIENLDIEVQFDTADFTSNAQNGELYVGALAGYNDGGRISDVNVTISSDDYNLSFASNISTVVNFGGIVGYNAGTIDLATSSVSSAEHIYITINSNTAYNIAMVAGENEGDIYGAYLGKSSLSSVNYTAIADLIVLNNSTGASANIAVISGINTGNIENVIVGGRIGISNSIGSNIVIDGYLSGISAQNTNTINTVASLGLELDATSSDIKVSGVVGYLTGSLSNARIMTARVEFANITTNGILRGDDVVAGVVAEMDNGQITFATVENFTLNAQSLYSTTNQVAGLVYSGIGTVARSLVSVDIDLNETAMGAVYLTSPTGINESDTYYIGKVLNFDDSKIVSRVDAGYHVVYTDENVYIYNGTSMSTLAWNVYFEAVDAGEIYAVVSTDDLITGNIMTLVTPTAQDFDQYLALGLYTTDGASWTLLGEDAVFSEDTEYYQLNDTVWNTMYHADQNGDLISNQGAGYDSSTTYYNIVDDDISDYYTQNGNVYTNVTDDNININTTYFRKLEWNDADWQTYIQSLIGGASYDTNIWSYAEDYNYITFNDINFYFPYLIDDEGNSLLVDRPNEIRASIDEGYIIEIGSEFIENEITVDNISVAHTAIINYHTSTTDYVSETYNSYYLMDRYDDEGNLLESGLLDVEVLPAGAEGGVQFRVVQGTQYAYINSNNQIVFTAVSNANPIIVRCYSVFNSEISTYVVFYTQLGISDLVLDSSTIYSSNEPNAEFELTTYTNANSILIDINAENIYRDQAFSTIFDANSIEEYLTVDAYSEATNSILRVDTRNSLRNVTISVISDSFDSRETSEIVNFVLKLNLTKYYGENIYPQIAGQDQYLELASTTLRVVVYKSASSLTINGGTSYEANTNANISFNLDLDTGYYDENDLAQYIPNDQITAYQNRILLNETGKDSIYLTIEAESEADQEKLNALMTQAGVRGVAELFDYSFSYELNRENGDIVGYRYYVELILKDDFDYRYIESDINLNITVTSVSSSSVRDSITVTFIPTALNTVRIENFTATNVTQISNYTSLLQSNATETSIISPGSYGGVMVIYLEPSYANVTDAILTSTKLYVPSLGRYVNIMFEQLVRNSDGTYQTYFGNNETVSEDNGTSSEADDKTGIRLNLISNSDNSYDGRIYIHTFIEGFVGYAGTIDVELTVNTINGGVVQTTKPLITEYLPGANVIYDGIATDDGGYLIQKATYENDVTIRVYGYQFNANPEIGLEWELDEDSAYEYDPTNTRFDRITLTEAEFNERVESGLDTYIEDATGVFVLAGDTYDANALYYEKVIDKSVIVDDSGNTYAVGNYVSYYFLSNYDQITQNSDGSYTVIIRMGVARNIPASFRVSARLSLATADSRITSDQEGSVIFHPVDYILDEDGLSLNNMSDGNVELAYNRTTGLNFAFATENSTYDYSSVIYEKMLQDLSDKGVNILDLFYYTNDAGRIVRFSESEYHPEFTVSLRDGIVTITGLDAFYEEITFMVKYDYILEDGQYVVRFVDPETNESNSARYTLTLEFMLNIQLSTTEEHARPIYSVDDIIDENLIEGFDYILMNDITLENFTPISKAIASLDGNNKVIKIRSFAVSVDRTNYGLFDSIGTYTYTEDGTEETRQTILKNVIVDYSEFNTNLMLTNNNITDIVFGGLVAVNNGGLIYNCDVMNLSTNTKTVSIIVDDSASVDVLFGGLVGENRNAGGFKGIITNSRVGRTEYTQIVVNSTGESTRTVYGAGLQFVVGSDTARGFASKVAGFVGVNSGIIASSYVANTGVTSYSSNLSTNMLAGFVAENTSTGEIRFSYVQAREDVITETNPHSTGFQIYAASNGSVGGFVYSNVGTISNSYANTELYTLSAFVAGFVYNNTGYIEESYSACIMNSDNATSDAAEQPFVGVDNNNNLLSDGTLSNVFYLLDDEANYTLPNSDKDQASGLNLENMSNIDSLTGFVFIDSNSRTERQQGVWSYYTVDNDYRRLPELNSANQIAHSYRYLLYQDENGVYNYTNARDFVPGSSNNPHIIRSVDEFNSTLRPTNSSAMSGYIRLINNIDFAENANAISTSLNYTLGDVNNNSITSLDGNGMTISGIVLDINESDTLSNDSVGLFSSIENAYVKNMNLEFASPSATNGVFSTSRAKYSGGLAGRVNNSVIINIDLDGASTTINGANFAGGLAGIVTGSSLVHGIDSNLSVQVQNTNPNYNLYYSEQDAIALQITTSDQYDAYLDSLSYAGGIAGVIDVTSRANVNYNLSFINIHGDGMYQRSDVEANILADYAGGIAGYASRNVNAIRLKYYTGTTDRISGQFAVGGLFAVLVGDITASQVTADEDIQRTYDKAFGEYIIALESGEDVTIDDSLIGNPGLLESYGYAGGLVGIGINSNIYASYSKASFISGVTVGGLLGVSVASEIRQSYAVPYINFDSTNIVYEKIGGLIGSAYASQNRNNEVGTYINFLNTILGVRNQSTDLIYTFSTILIDREDIANTNTNGDNIEYNYVAADFGRVGQYDFGDITSNGGTTMQFTYSGRVSQYELETDTDGVALFSTFSNHDENLADIYNVEAQDQESIFNTIFGGWETQYWSLDHERYFPLLLENRVLNYIEIATASDFLNMLSNPTGSYKIVQDIDLANGDDSWYDKIATNSNFIFDIDFQGVLVGEKEDDGGIPVVSGLKLSPGYSNQDAGLFRQSTNAIFRNITFVWEDGTDNVAVNLNNKVTINTFGGVSAYDQNSQFTNITVRVANTSANNESNPNIETSLFGESNITNRGSIAGFGGVVGHADNSTITNCTFSGYVNTNLSNSVSTSNIDFGAIVGLATRSGFSEDEEGNIVEGNTTIMNSYVGMNYSETEDIEKTKFDLTILAGSTVNIGGAVGRAVSSAVSAINVGGYTYSSDYQKVTFNIKLAGNTNSYVNFGGLVGNSDNSVISSSDVLSEINLTGDSGVGESTGGQRTIVAGLIGFMSVNSTSVSLSAGNVDNSNTQAIINIGNSSTNTTIGNLYVSTGIGYASATNNNSISIEQCLFTGTISSEDEDGGYPNISVARAGGALAYGSTNSTIRLSEVMTTTDIILGGYDSYEMYIGGLVGQAYRVELINCESIGRVIPITDENSDISEMDFYFAGLVGKVDGSVLANAVYSLSSIITDSVQDSSIQKVNASALFGDVENLNKDEIQHVYYSSDYALVPELSGVGSNLSAYTLARSNSWRIDISNPFNSSQNIWAEVTGVDTNSNTASEFYLPFIASLTEAMTNYSIMSLNTTAGSRGYTYIPSALNPTILTGTNSDSNWVESYKYYIMSSNEVDHFSLPTSDGTNNVALNGILMGGETEYDISSFDIKNITIGGDGSLVYYGIIPAVARHSAVSNLHIRLDADTALTGAGIFGLIVGYNDGVVSNVSVQGTGITLGLNNGQDVGLIVGQNEGMLEYAYSTAEIVKLNYTDSGSDNRPTLAGIAYQNAGLLVSSYFTGYIDNRLAIGEDNLATDSIISAGILIQIQTDSLDSYEGYIYNCYMAGVIEQIGSSTMTEEDTDNYNSFIAYADGLFTEGIEDSADSARGKNNYIDSLSNVETVSIGTNGEVLRTALTADLMANNSLLSGSWHLTAKRHTSGYIYFDTASLTYGYNYLYPVIAFNKLASGTLNGDIVTFSDGAYQLYTGTGANVDGEYANASVSTIDAFASNMTALNNAMRIPHLGVLSAIQSLAIPFDADGNVSMVVNSNQTKLNYVLIYDIDKEATWMPVGGRDNGSAFYDGALASFNGLFISSKYYDFEMADGSAIIQLDATGEGSASACIVSGLTDGLFDNIQDSYIGYIKFGSNSTSGFSASGLLGKTVNGLTTADGNSSSVSNIVVDNIQILEGTTVTANNNTGADGGDISTAIGALFGTISSGNVTIKDFITYFVFAGVQSYSVTLYGAESMGLIAGQMTGGTLTLSNENVNEYNSTLYVNFTGDRDDVSGGLIGNINSNVATRIIGNEYIIKITADDRTRSIASLGGIIGSATGTNSTVSASVENIIVDLSANDDPINTRILGGLIASSSQNITFTDCAIDFSSEIRIESTLSDDEVYQFGMLAASVQGGILTVDNLYSYANAEAGTITIQMNSTDTESRYSTIYEQNHAFGGLVGSMSDGEVSYSFNTTGMTGAEGKVGLKMPSITVQNGYNLGGIVGVYSGGTISITNASEDNQDYRYMVNIKGTTNVGGAVGLVTDDISDMIDEDDGTWNFLAEDYPFATISSVSTGFTNRYNYGGLFGYYKANILGNEIAEGETVDEDEIDYIVNANIITIPAVDADTPVVIYNVGGIAGNTDATVITNLKNEGNIDGLTTDDTNGVGTSTNVLNVNTEPDSQGTQAVLYKSIRTVNVGGVVGVLPEDVTITNIQNTATIVGYQNVGGLVGIASGTGISLDNADSTYVKALENGATSLASGTYYQRVVDDATGLVRYDLVSYNADTDTGTDLDSLYNLNTESNQSGSIIGAVNVGGVVGYVNGAEIVNVYASGNVFGNANVGGMVGYLKNSNSYVSYNFYRLETVEDVMAPTEILVKGIYVNYKTLDEEEDVVISNYVIPTNIGGFVGYAFDGVIEYNTVLDVSVTSAQEGLDSNAGIVMTNTNNLTISTNANNMVDVNIIESSSNGAGVGYVDVEMNNDNIVNYNHYEFETSDGSMRTVDFNDISTGYGGFAGAIHTNVTLNRDSSDTYFYINTNTFAADTVASLGVNVGAYYGYYYAADNWTQDSVVTVIQTPELVGRENGEVIVSGGYSVGGVIGQYAGESIGDFDLGKVAGNVTIYIQGKTGTDDTTGATNGDASSIVGMYVGGLIGQLTVESGDSPYLAITEDMNVKVRINTTNTYYSGGLVGRVLANGDITFRGDVSTQVTTGGYSDSSVSTNFGGLIGMLKVAESSSENSGYVITVEGTHYYAFTINTIENSNYYDAPSVYDASESDNEVYLTAIATYVNLDSFRISPTSDASFYSERAKNPTRPDDSWGWAAEYTMFKQMQRAISQTEAEWDAISEVYDAQNIKYVATIDNLRLENTALAGPSKLWTDSVTAAINAGILPEDTVVDTFSGSIKKPTQNTGESNEDYSRRMHAWMNLPMIGKSGSNYIFNPNYICYTVYEEVEGMPKLYSPIGIADPYYDNNGDYDTPQNIGPDYWQWAGAIFGWNEPPPTLYNLNLNEGIYKGLTYLDFSEGTQYTTINPQPGEDSKATFWESNKSFRQYFCTIDNYDGQSVYFQFNVFYENNTLSNSGVSVTVSDKLADSGSMFDTNGVATTNYDTVMKNKANEETYPWYKGWKTFVTVVEIAGIFVGFGGMSLIKGAGKLIGKGIVSLVKKMTVKKLIKGALNVLIGYAISQVIFGQSLATLYVQSTYSNVRNQTLGYMSESYQRSVKFENGVMVVQSDSAYVGENGDSYLYYSSTRPNDYYINRYYVYHEENGAYVTELLSELPVDISNNDPIGENNDFAGAYEYTYGGTTYYAYPYYEYQDGAYYILADAVEMEYRLTQYFDTSDMREDNDYVMNRGYYYVRGSYDSDDMTYEVSGGVTNSLSYSNGEYSVNGVEWSNTTAANKGYEPTYSSKAVSYYPILGVSASGGVLRYTVMGETVIYNLGYGYMQGAYYTARGNNYTSITGMESLYKVGTFTRDDSLDLTDLTKGVDYIQVNEYTRDAEGVIIDITPHYYKLASVTEPEENDSTASYTGDISVEAGNLNASYTYRLYPDSFTDPYHISFAGNSKDSVYYIAYQYNTSISSPIRHTPTYYYYEGGYHVKTQNTDEGTEYTAYIKIIDSEEVGNDEISKNKGNISLYIYDEENNNSTQVYRDNEGNNFTIADLISVMSGNSIAVYYGEISTSARIDDLYINDVSGLISDEELRIYSLSYNYYYQANDGLYRISDSANIIDGNLATVDIILPQTNNTDTNYNYNKYLVNPDAQIYTRYKYDSTEQLFNGMNLWLKLNADGTSMDDSSYYIYREGYAQPNAGKTTYLVEGCRVILGGGIFYNTSTSNPDNGNGTVVGSIGII